ncbi:MAG: hypothetical protein ACRDHZ_22230, partial [Ktedonobacteraceae bacterium]
MAARSSEATTTTTSQHAVVEQKREKAKMPFWNRQRSETLAAYLFLLPYLFVLLVFFALVSVYGVGLSFFTVDLGFTPPQFVGLHNYQVLFNQLFTDPSLSPFWISLVNIFKFTVIVVIGQTILALILAMLLQTLVH